MRTWNTLIAIAIAIAPAVAGADLGDCSQPVSSGAFPTASDCLFILRASVGSQLCEPSCICDADRSGTISPTDALRCLKKVVGQPVALRCPCGGSTTTSTTSTSTSPITTSTLTTLSTTTVSTTTTSTTTTTTSTSTTTTTTTTTTTLPTDPRCPNRSRAVVHAGYGAACSSNADCVIGTCDAATAHCRTATSLRIGWTGHAHAGDLDDGAVVATKLACPGPPDPGCGQCIVVGLDPAPGNCRCSDDNRTSCDQPFTPDDDDCGGSQCTCYFGPPLPTNSGNAPLCTVNRFARDVSGTADVDSGEWDVEADLRAVAYIGESMFVPCPYCDGDVVAGDGVRDGTCVGGENAGQSCDVDAVNRTFPAPGGGGHSLDCFPSLGRNISGTGLAISLGASTGSSSLGSGVVCGFPGPPLYIVQACQCGLCSDDASDATACSSNADCGACTTNSDCASGGAGGECDVQGRCECVRLANLQPQPNSCLGQRRCIDVDAADGVGECEEGPVDRFCDGIVRASGGGFVQCSTNADCAAVAIGMDAGACLLTQTRSCFLDTIIAVGTSDPATPVVGATFCSPHLSDAGFNVVLGVPGPVRVTAELETTLFCASDPGTLYEPGIGGCP